MAAGPALAAAVWCALAAILLVGYATLDRGQLVVGGAALVAALGGAVLVALANREHTGAGPGAAPGSGSHPSGARLIFDILLLALASTVRPTSLAAVSAILSHESRRRLLFAYVVVGLAFTIAFGVVVVGVVHGIHFHSGSARTKGVANIAGGVAALLFGCAVLAGLIGRGQDQDVPGKGIDWTARLDRRLTVRTAAIAGPLTHIPGLFYLIALNIIVAHNPRLPGGLLAVSTYDVIWFALPLAALAMCIVNPDAARQAVVSVQRWTGQHSRTLLVSTSFVVGVALVIRGALAL